MTRRAFVLAAGLVLSAAPLLAEITISAQADKTTVAINEQITLSVTVSGSQASLPSPNMPSLANFSVYSSGQSQSISFINGSLSSSIVYTYVLVPRSVGKFSIDPIWVETGGQKVATSAIPIEVVRPGAQGGSAGASGQPQAAPRPRASPPPQNAPEGAPDVFVTAQLDKDKVFVDQQAILTVRFYTAVNLLSNPQYNPPELAGFLAEDLPPERHGSVNLHGRNYYFSEVKSALFPAQSGTLRIGPAGIRVQVQKQAPINMNSSDFFDRFFAQGMGLLSAQTLDLQSKPLTLTAETLPQNGKPAGFSGAVGDFSILAAADKTQVHVGDALDLIVTVAGEGNIKSIGSPSLPSLPEFRTYDTVGSTNINKKNDAVQGSRVFKTVLVPKVSGRLSIPSISFSYFDPRRRQYVTRKTSPIAVSVSPAAPGSTPAVAYLPPSAQSAAPGITVLDQDIRYLKAGGETPWLERFLSAVASAGWIHLIPFLIFGTAFSRDQYLKSLERDPKRTRFRAAQRTALARLKDAELADDPHKAADLTADAFIGYLADKIGQPAAGLTWRAVQAALETRAAKRPELITQIKELWNELDMRRFAPSAAGAGASNREEPVAAKIREAIEALEKELRP